MSGGLRGLLTQSRVRDVGVNTDPLPPERPAAPARRNRDVIGRRVRLRNQRDALRDQIAAIQQENEQLRHQAADVDDLSDDLDEVERARGSYRGSDRHRGAHKEEEEDEEDSDSGGSTYTTEKDLPHAFGEKATGTDDPQRTRSGYYSEAPDFLRQVSQAEEFESDDAKGTRAVNKNTLKSSAHGWSLTSKIIVYSGAVALAIFVATAPAFDLANNPTGGGGHADSDGHDAGHDAGHDGSHHAGHNASHNATHNASHNTSSDASHGDPHGSHHEETGDHGTSHDGAHVASTTHAPAHHHRVRRLWERLLQEPSTQQNRVARNIAYATVFACGVAFLMHLLKQPLLLGYLLGGVLAGPIGFKIITDHHEIETISELGLVLLLFMIGLELDVGELLKMGKVVLLTGFLQFPLCAGAMTAIFLGLEAAGLDFGAGQFAGMYVGLTCGISSTMIVVKLLSQKMESDTSAGRLTVGILIFQDIWAIILLAIQPNLDNFQIITVVQQFGLMFMLLLVAFLYSKYVLPAIFSYASSVVELMLILSLAWCFFICAIAELPFVGLSTELAALIAGVTMATFPYSAEFNGKIKYIRDFFITLYFVSLGMQIPTPDVKSIGIAILVAIFVVMFRWLGIFLPVLGLGGGARLGIVSTINLSQISEFALVICSLGKSYEHVENDTMVILIWTFSILAVAASYMIGGNQKIADFLEEKVCRKKDEPGHGSKGDGHGHGDQREILFLGFHRIAAEIVLECQECSPHVLKKIHIIDNNVAVSKKLKDRGVGFSYGDIASVDVLEHCFHGQPQLILVTADDTGLIGTTNLKLLEVSRELWPEAQVILTAANENDSAMLYRHGADYVLKISNLGAERIADMLVEHYQSGIGGGELKNIMHQQKTRERERTDTTFQDLL